MFTSSNVQQGGFNNVGYPVSQSSWGFTDGGKQDLYQQPNYVEISPQSGLNSSTFELGNYDFNVSSGNNSSIIWNRSFFKIQLKLTTRHAYNANPDLIIQGQPTTAEQITFSQMAPASLFSNCSFQISNNDISKSSQFLHQATTLYTRLGYGPSILYKNSELWWTEPNFYKRRDMIANSSDTPTALARWKNNIVENIPDINSYCIVQDGLNCGNPTMSYAHANNRLTITYDATVPIPQRYALLNAGDIFNISIGDSIFHINAGARTAGYLKVTAVPDGGNGDRTILTERMDAFPAADLAVAVGVLSTTSLFNKPLVANWFIVRQGQSDPFLYGCRSNQHSRAMLYQPPLGIFGCADPLSGEFKVTLKPNTNYKTAAIQCMYNTLPTGSFELSVTDIKMYCYTVKHNVSPERPLLLKLMELDISQQTITAASSTLNFTVPVSTRSIAVFLTDSRSGLNGGLSVPQCEFRTLDNIQPYLERLQVNYGGIQLPTSFIQTEKKEYSTSFSTYVSANFNTPNVNSISIDLNNVVPNSGNNYKDTSQYRYIDYLISTGKIFSDGAESYKHFANSPIYFFDFNSSIDTNSSVCRIQYAFSAIPGYSSAQGQNSSTYYGNLCVASFYSTVVKGEYKSNILSGLISMNV
jgi:hypothetical protein